MKHRPDHDAAALRARGFVRVEGTFAGLGEAWTAAEELVAVCSEPGEVTEVIADYVIPPPDASPSRDFQTLHFDFGLPLVPVVAGEVARFTALHLRLDAPSSGARTRLVPLRALLAKRPWPDHHELARRFAAYGQTHGAWDDADGYVEGSLARIIEAASGLQPALPRVKNNPEFLCGLEFASILEEEQFMRDRNLDLNDVGVEIRLQPGELLVFDNLTVAHGRRGSRRPGELHQRIFGQQEVSVEAQVAIRDRILTAFAH